MSISSGPFGITLDDTDDRLYARRDHAGSMAVAVDFALLLGINQ